MARSVRFEFSVFSHSFCCIHVATIELKKVLWMSLSVDSNGCSCDIQETGLHQLDIGCNLRGSLRQVLCAMVLLGYHLFVSYVLGYGEGNLDLCDKILKQELAVSFVYFNPHSSLMGILFACQHENPPCLLAELSGRSLV